MGEGSKVELAYQVLESFSKENWRRAALLIIDEISMISADIFDKLDYIGRVVRGVNKPFGGVQLVCCGDFFQLPPVRKKAVTSNDSDNNNTSDTNNTGMYD